MKKRKFPQDVVKDSFILKNQSTLNPAVFTK